MKKRSREKERNTQPQADYSDAVVQIIDSFQENDNSPTVAMRQALRGYDGDTAFAICLGALRSFYADVLSEDSDPNWKLQATRHILSLWGIMTANFQVDEAYLEEPDRQIVQYAKEVLR